MNSITAFQPSACSRLYSKHANIKPRVPSALCSQTKNTAVLLSTWQSSAMETTLICCIMFVIEQFCKVQWCQVYISVKVTDVPCIVECTVQNSVVQYKDWVHAEKWQQRKEGRKAAVIYRTLRTLTLTLILRTFTEVQKERKKRSKQNSKLRKA